MGSNIKTLFWIDELIRQYSASVKDFERYKQTLNRTDLYQALEAETVSGVIADMRYALDWMRRGRRPGGRKGAERRDIYRRRELLAQVEPLSDAERQRLLDCVAVMTERELTCWLLHMAHGLTQQEIADRLGVTRTSVQQFINRAKHKIQRMIS